VMEMVKVTAMERPGAVVHLSAQTAQHLSTKKHKRHKKHKRAFEKILCLLCVLCLFVASSLLRRKFAFLFFVESLLIFLDPGFEILRCLFEFVAIQQTAAQRFEERARPDVVS
jgi:hypothetical protein